jgi:succinate dehydrogenase/fumarate reductase cytochrome b subunit
VLSKQAYHSMSDGHLWFSIFSRPLSSKFTRVQRCTCCFVLLFTAMLFNILYYEQSEASKTASDYADLSMGPFYFSREQVCCTMNNK